MVKVDDVYVTTQLGELGTHENSNIYAVDLKSCVRSSPFWLLCPPSACNIPGPEGWNPSTYLLYSSAKPCLSTLPNFTSSRPPLGIQSWGRLMAPKPGSHGHALPLFLGKFPFLCGKACATRAPEPGGRLCGQTWSTFNNKMINKSKYRIKSLRVGVCHAIL